MQSARMSEIGPSNFTLKITDHKRRMPLKDKISLGPIEKYTIYNRFPYKLMLHILLLILMSILVSTVVSDSQSQLRAQQFVWYSKFILNDEDDDPVPVMDDFNREKRFFTVDDLKEFVNTSLNNYQDMKDDPDNEFEEYVIAEDEKPQLFTITLNTQTQDPAAVNLTYNDETKEWSDPFDKDDVEFKQWLANVGSFKISYKNIKV